MAVSHGTAECAVVYGRECRQREGAALVHRTGVLLKNYLLKYSLVTTFTTCRAHHHQPSFSYIFYLPQLPTYLLTFLSTFLPTYVQNKRPEGPTTTRLSSLIPSNVRSFLPFYLPPYLFPCLPSFLPTYLPKPVTQQLIVHAPRH